MIMVKLGIDRIAEYEGFFKGKKTGLITNPSGVSSSGISSFDALATVSNLSALFAPEHGIRGDRQDGEEIESYTDPRTGVIVHSIYGKYRKPDSESIRALDILCYDIQDVGSRYYTFIYSMAVCMKAAAVCNVEFVVFDRPNPISCLSPSGSRMYPENMSFVGMFDIPQRYSLTVGELARMLNDREGIGADLTVIEMEGYRRDMYYDDTGLLWIPPSPNIPDLDSSILYNGTCLFEGTNISEGRGTTHPFVNIGAPFIDSEAWIHEIGKYGIRGILLRPVSFIPMYSKYKGEVCNGVYIHITDRTAFDPLKLGVVMIRTAKELFPDSFRFTPPKHEVGEYTADLFYGSSLLRRDGVSVQEIFDDIDSYTSEYLDTWRKYWLYN